MRAAFVGFSDFQYIYLIVRFFAGADHFGSCFCVNFDFKVATVWHEIFGGVYFCGLAIFGVLRELIFVIFLGGN